MELLKSSHIRSFVVGASNYLYKRQKGLSDVLVDVSTKELSHISINLLSKFLSQTLQYELLKATCSPFYNG